MKNKVEGHPKYAQIEQDCDVAALFEVIKEVLLICMSNNIQHTRLQVVGSNWHIAISRRMRQLCNFISSSVRQWIVLSECMGRLCLQ
jgi:hypothetical protein